MPDKKLTKIVIIPPFTKRNDRKREKPVARIVRNATGVLLFGALRLSRFGKPGKSYTDNTAFILSPGVQTRLFLAKYAIVGPIFEK